MAASRPVEPSQTPTGEPVTFLPPSHWAQVAAVSDPRSSDLPNRPLCFVILGLTRVTTQEAEADGDTDSALGDDDTASATESISSTIRNYRHLQGRTYHGEVGNAEYWFVIRYVKLTPLAFKEALTSR